MKILYVDINPRADKGEGSQERVRKHQQAVLASLRRRHFTSLVYDFQSTRVDEALSQGYDLLITHLPYSERTHLYLNSLFRLQFITQNYPRMKVIVYTGASPGDVKDDDLKQQGAIAVVRKHDTGSDIKKLEDLIEALPQT